MARARERGATVVPVDSEHSAVFQCIRAASPAEVSRIILTASGGPFAGRTRPELARVTVEEALCHPNWRMGPKITVDSATLMNKGLEVIEASHLFGVAYGSIVVTLHRESIVHSMVEFVDGAVLAQMGLPDMRLPIQYALTYPERIPGPVRRYDPWRERSLSFAMPDTGSFPLLRLAYEAGEAGGALPAVMSAANEVAVREFLAGRIGFLDIAEIVESVLARVPVLGSSCIREILEADAYGRTAAFAQAARIAREGVQ
jgi:1-deoxy-D-xylulose-5-phosphate reductoisomerase